MKIFLLGLPGSGKTTLAARLSKELDIPFVDLDAEIEKRSGKKIHEIFADEGEAAFRKVEAEELRIWCSSQGNFVMATGGGTPCFFDSMDVILKSGKSVFLDVAPSEIARRMERTKLEERPLLGEVSTDKVLKRLRDLHESRLPYYTRANITVKGSSLTYADLLEKLSG